MTRCTVYEDPEGIMPDVACWSEECTECDGNGYRDGEIVFYEPSEDMLNLFHNRDCCPVCKGRGWVTKSCVINIQKRR